MNSPAETRDAALRRLRRVSTGLTAGSVIGGGAIFAAVAAATPHHATVHATPVRTVSPSPATTTAPPARVRAHIAHRLTPAPAPAAAAPAATPAAPAVTSGAS